MTEAILDGLDSELVCYKGLRLIRPELANALDIPAEAPVFTSPVFHTAAICGVCNETVKPLVYSAGNITIGHTSHEWNPAEPDKFGALGGVFFSIATKQQFREMLANFNFDMYMHYGWLATLTPLGQPTGQEARIDTIMAVCRSTRCKRETLVEGVAAVYPYGDEDIISQQNLVPVCSADMAERNGFEPLWHFNIKEGIPSFSPLVQPQRSDLNMLEEYSERMRKYRI